MRLSWWECLELESSMRWWIVMSIWTEACQLEKKASKWKWHDYCEVTPTISHNIPLRATPKGDPQSNPNQIKPNQTKPVRSEEKNESLELVATQPNEYQESMKFLKEIDIDNIKNTEPPLYARDYHKYWIEFVLYWTEKWKTWKMRAEWEKTFEVKRRFYTWLSRAKVQYEKPQQKFNTIW